MIISRQSSFRSFILSLLTLSITSSKALHLFQHASSLPRSQFVLYFPTFFILEAILSIGAWILLFKTSGFKLALGNFLTLATTILCFVLSASQFGFYIVTGSEVHWDAATTVGNDPEGRKLMMSGLRSFLGAATIIIAVSWLLKHWIYWVINRWFAGLFKSESKDADKEALLPITQQRSESSRSAQFWTLLALFSVGLLHIARPQVPYNHLSGAIPFTFLQAIGSKHSEPHQIGEQTFPLPDLIGEEYWEGQRGHFKGWAPGTKKIQDEVPTWASGDLPPGFDRWAQDLLHNEKGEDHRSGNNASQKHTYSPAEDPLRITNLDRELLGPVARALKDHKVPITHVVLVLMESARKDIFPFKAGSHLHEEILSSYQSQSPEILSAANLKLSNLTPNAEKLTGEQSGLPEIPNSSAGSGGSWNDTAESGMGGINFHGVLTGSSLSFKSAIINYCGAGPLPVDFMDEANAENYQPCIMQILELFNTFKKNSTAKGTDGSGSGSETERIIDRKWRSMFLQSITGLYDEQDVLNEKMGFQEAIYREDIDKRDALHYHKDMEEINYFGYPEQEIYPYLKDVVNSAIEKKERLFLSHFTSTTHHPWGTPAKYPQEQYFANKGLVAKHEEMNKYLNSVRYVDTWLGEMMQVLDDSGIANETLVVLVGDHGQAFTEDSPVSGTYENGHISNFRIPLVFRHPLLPKLQVTANATSMSVVPTILDLLVNSGSLDEMDSSVALDLMNEYEGQSLIRPYQATHNGRQAWNFGIINPGGTMLSVGSAAVPYRLILPLSEDFEYVFSNLETDPNELSPEFGWSLEELIEHVESKHGDEAGKWLMDAEKVGRWWVGNQKRLWNYQ